MILKTRIFDLLYLGNLEGKSKYKNMTELAKGMRVSPGYIYKVREGKRKINQKFILGAVMAFPGYKLDDLFYIEEGRENASR